MSARAATGSEPIARRVVAWSVGLAFLGVSYVGAVRQRAFSAGDTCLIHRATGWKCPLCGMTHAVVALFHGHVLSAIASNALALPLVLACIIGVAAVTSENVRVAVDQRRRELPRLAFPAALLVGVGYAIVRNL